MLVYVLNIKRGFSLIEVLIYIALLVTLTTITVSSVLSLAGNFQELRVMRTIQHAALSSLERISVEIRAASSVGVASSTLDAHPGALTLNQSVGGGGTDVVDLYLDNGVLQMKRNTVLVGALTPQNVRVTNLVFRRIDNVLSEGVRVELRIRATSGRATREEDFYTFLILRGAY